MVRRTSSVAGEARRARASSASTRAIVVVALAMFSMTGLAYAAQPPAEEVAENPSPAADRDAGIAHATQAGITVDPAVVPMMKRAPAGSCENDPTLAGCPTVKAVVYAPEFFGLATNAPSATASRHVRRLRAHAPRARASLYQCALKVTDQSPYKAAGYAQGDYSSFCSTAVSENDIYISLSKYDLNWQSWRLIVSRWIDNASRGTTHYYHLAQDCNGTVQRAWEAQIDGYAVVQGVWYAGTQEKYNNLYCNYP